METALFESVSEEDSHKHEPRLARETLGAAERNRRLLRAVPEAGAVKTLGADLKKDIADCFMRLTELPTFALIASLATNTCCGDKRGRLCLRWSRCGAASDSRPARPFHSRSGGASPAPRPKNPCDHSRGQPPCPKSSGNHEAKTSCVRPQDRGQL